MGCCYLFLQMEGYEVDIGYRYYSGLEELFRLVVGGIWIAD